MPVLKKSNPTRRALRLCCSLAACGLLLFSPAQAEVPTGGLRVFRETNSINQHAPSYLARSLDASVAPGSTSYSGVELIVGGSHAGLKIDSSLLVLGRGDSKSRSRGRFNELYLSRKAGALQVSGGLRIIDWDVGFGFRPNDMVMMEATRPLVQTPRRGKYVLAADYFGKRFTTSAVWINPHRINDRKTIQFPDKESALAGQIYSKVRDLDLYAFGRYGQRTGSSAGLAVVGVPTDSITLQGSVRLIRHYRAWTSTGPLEQIYAESPWSRLGRPNVKLASLGGSWAGSSKQSVFLEYWYDERAPSDGQWADWKQRNLWLQQLAQAVRSGALQLPAQALAGNLAWQELPMEGLNQRRDNILLRLAWQPEDLAFTLDTVYSPSDGGLTYTLAAQWRSQGLTLNAAARWLGGPVDSVSRQVPTGTSAHVSATWSF